jgi:soluble lytic murein transglycosylase-like protein
MTVPTKPPVSPVAPSSPKVRSLPEQATLIAKKYKIPPKLFLALVRQESRWNYRAVSKKGALGLTQVMPHNVKALGYKLSRFKTSPGAQLEAGARILNTEYKRFCRWDLALAAYNAGSGAVRKYAGIPPYRETITYVRRIIGAAS